MVDFTEKLFTHIKKYPKQAELLLRNKELGILLHAPEVISALLNNDDVQLPENYLEQLSFDFPINLSAIADKKPYVLPYLLGSTPFRESITTVQQLLILASKAPSVLFNIPYALIENASLEECRQLIILNPPALAKHIAKGNFNRYFIDLNITAELLKPLYAYPEELEICYQNLHDCGILFIPDSAWQAIRRQLLNVNTVNLNRYLLHWNHNDLSRLFINQLLWRNPLEILIEQLNTNPENAERIIAEHQNLITTFQHVKSILDINPAYLKLLISHSKIAALFPENLLFIALLNEEENLPFNMAILKHISSLAFRTMLIAHRTELAQEILSVEGIIPNEQEDISVVAYLIINHLSDFTATCNKNAYLKSFFYNSASFADLLVQHPENIVYRNNLLNLYFSFRPAYRRSACDLTQEKIQPLLLALNNINNGAANFALAELYVKLSVISQEEEQVRYNYISQAFHHYQEIQIIDTLYPQARLEMAMHAINMRDTSMAIQYALQVYYHPCATNEQRTLSYRLAQAYLKSTAYSTNQGLDITSSTSPIDSINAFLSDMNDYTKEKIKMENKLLSSKL